MALIMTDYEEGRLQPTPLLATRLFLSLQDILRITIRKKITEIDEKRLRKKVVLIKTDYEERRLQPTPARHPKGELLSTRYYTINYRGT
jgi:hypothetical protein